MKLCSAPDALGLKSRSPDIRKLVCLRQTKANFL